MRFDFTTILDRRHHDALAVDRNGYLPGIAPTDPQSEFDFIPMWVADMNFPVVPSVTQAISQRLAEPHFGYFVPREAYYQAILKWQADHNQVTDIQPEYIGYENGVLGGIASTITCFAAPGDAVLLHSPTYVGFTHTLELNGYKIIHSPLVLDEHNVYRMDYADMERKLAEHQIHVAIFCSPHNPTGRVWEREEIERAMAIYRKYDCVVISDEIWSDLLLNGHQHIPTHTVNEDAKQRTVSFYAPSKTFNLAGLVGSYHLIYNTLLRDRVRAKAAKTHYNEMNVLSMYGLIGAYQPEGYQWLEELKQVLSHNVNYAVNYIQTHFKGVHVSQPEGTYLVYIDCAQWLEQHHLTLEALVQRGWDVGVGWQNGRAFNGSTHIRINLALPFSRIEEAFKRLDEYVFNTKKK